MLWKDAFIYTLREIPAEAETVSHKLMLRAGMIQKLSAGIYNYLPLGLRVIRKIEAIIRKEMALCGATELLMPMVIPAQLWRESGRWDYYGPELLRIVDRKNNDFCLGPTHEEVIVDVVRKTVRSYRDLPKCLFQIQSKFRDEVRPRYGLMRGREFIMKDAYSFHADEKSLDEMYWVMYKAYTRIFEQCGLEFRPVEADSGAIGGSVTHEFHVLADSGEDTIASCNACDYAANIEKAHSRIPEALQTPANAPMVEQTATPGKKTIEEVAAYLQIDPQKTIKMLLYEVNGGEYLVGVCIRGDAEVNEAKLRALLGAQTVAIPAEEDLKKRHNIPFGYIGPYEFSLKEIKEIIADFSIQTLQDAVCGANKEDCHLIHVYPGRDFKNVRYADVGFIGVSDACPRCDHGVLALRKGIEVGQVFKLGRKYAQPMKLTYLTENNADELMTMGCYGIGVGRTAAAAIEQNSDKDGIMWPLPLAPYTVALLCLDSADKQCASVAAAIHDGLEKHGIDVLLDDREERPGVKFKDADLIGCPLRVTVGSRGLKEGIIEVKWRREKETEKIPQDLALEKIFEIIHNKLGKTL
ncbi:MAG TPA: proline--tRNA ligase [Chitinivibrionales bacterium]